MKKNFFQIAFLLCFLFFPEQGMAEPFLDQWEWHPSRMFGKVKIIMKEEAVYNVKQIFNDQQRKIEEQLLNKGQVIYKTIFQYDTQGNLIAILRYSGDGHLLVKETTVYEGGNLKYIQSSNEPSNGKLLYDEKGMLDEIIVSKGDGSRVAKYVYRFNMNRDLIEMKILDEALKLRERKVFFYDQKGFPVGELTYNSTGELIRKDVHAYEYDHQGNWIVKTTQSEVFIGSQKGKIAPSVERRKFTYFNR